MNKMTIIVAALIAMAGSAQAGGNFDGGNISITGSTFVGSGGPPTSVYPINAQSQFAFGFGNFGFQVDTGATTLFGSGISAPTFSNFNIHAYNKGGSAKYGAYASSFFFINNIGVEAMFNMAGMDVEVRAGAFDNFIGPSQSYNLSAKAYYGLSNLIELSAEYTSVFASGVTGFDAIDLGIKYDMGNNLNLNANYLFDLNNSGVGAVSVGVQYELDGNSDDRLFSVPIGFVSRTFF